MGSFTPPPTTALAPGDRLDRYELLCILAQGGMGTVWLARLTGKLGFERLVALKTILATFGTDRQFCDMFLDEARIAAQVDHENVARILEIGEDRGILYHAMELVDGESLRKVYRDIRSVGAPFPLAVALRIAADTCAGLHAVHELKDSDGLSLEVVHRDVSPQNILITIRGTIKLIDFGVAKARQRRTEETTAGTLKGKIEYMAPEQARGDKIDRRADVYAIGAVLYELLSGEPVRSTEEGRQLLALHELMTGAPYEPLHHSIPLPIRSLVDRALSQNPDERFRTAEDMRHALEQVMVTIGHVASTDDVANVLVHYSRERTSRRKDAIDASLKAAQAMDKDKSGESRASLHTKIAPLSAPIVEQHPLHGRMSVGPQGTRVIGVQALAAEGGHHSTAPSITTGPSMRSMQGTSISEYPTAPRASTSAGKIFAALVVLSVVGVLGVVAGVVFSRNNMPPSSGGASPPVTVVPMPPPVTAAGATTTAPTTTGGAPPVLDPNNNTGVVLGASDAGAGSSASATGSAAGSSGKAGGKKGGKGKSAGGQKSESGDEYGF